MTNDLVGKFLDNYCDKCSKNTRNVDGCDAADNLLIGYFDQNIPDKTIEFVDGLDTPCPHFAGKGVDWSKVPAVMQPDELPLLNKDIQTGEVDYEW